MTLTRQIDWCRATLLAALGAGSAPACGGTVTATDATQGLPAEDAALGPVAADATPGLPTADAAPSCGAASERLLEGGFAATPAGFIHRPTAGSCPNHLPPASAEPIIEGDAGFTDGGGGVAAAYCRADTDCIEGAHGRCVVTIEQVTGYPYPAFRDVLSCRYACVTDADCAVNQICECGSEFGRCMPSSCTTDSSCASGEVCAQAFEWNDCEGYWYVARYECTALATECCVDSDCSDGRKCANGSCQPLGDCCCGRPFLVGGQARIAQAVLRADFARTAQPDMSSLSFNERAILADHWTRIGLMEHASIAAFSRFTLELLQVGAPAELVEAAGGALGDELEHARLAFGLATAYGDRAVGPGALEIAGSLAACELEDVVRTAFLEGCIGETVAALEAAVARDAALDPTVIAVLDRIAADELRHAALAYRFVRWALAVSAPRAREAIEAVLRSEVNSALATPLEPRGEELGTSLRAHGLLPAADRRRLEAEAIREIVLPCVETLLARSQSEAPGGLHRTPTTRPLQGHAVGRAKHDNRSRRPMKPLTSGS